MTAPAARGVRLAAAYLESVAAADRKWLLAQLPPQTAQHLEAERAQLPASLRRTRIRDLIWDIARPDPAVTTTPQPAPPQNFEAFLDDAEQLSLAEADAAIVVPLLAARPAWFCAAVLTIQDWPWRSALIAAMPALQSTTVISATTVTTRRAMVRALVSELEAS